MTVRHVCNVVLDFIWHRVVHFFFAFMQLARVKKFDSLYFLYKSIFFLLWRLLKFAEASKAAITTKTTFMFMRTLFYPYVCVFWFALMSAETIPPVLNIWHQLSWYLFMFLFSHSLCEIHLLLLCMLQCIRSLVFFPTFLIFFSFFPN